MGANSLPTKGYFHTSTLSLLLPVTNISVLLGSGASQKAIESTSVPAPLSNSAGARVTVPKFVKPGATARAAGQKAGDSAQAAQTSMVMSVVFILVAQSNAWGA